MKEACDAELMPVNAKKVSGGKSGKKKGKGKKARRKRAAVK